jgi:hypothetical protein
MRAGIAAAALALLAAATPVAATVVEITATMSVADAEDGQALHAAVQAAVEEALRDVGAFRPTLVVVTRAVVIGDRLHVRVLLSDENALDAPAAGPAAGASSAEEPRI